MIRPFAFLFLLFALAQNGLAADWTVNKTASHIGFGGTHAGSSFEGQFTDWSAKIRFDPENLTAASAYVVIQTASASTGNNLYDTTLPGEDWFHTAQFGEAIFEANGFSATGEATYRTDGTLTIRGKALPLTLEFSLSIEGDTAIMTARHTLDRLAYGMGATSDPTADWVSKDIDLTFRVSARRQ